jgi:hypothetical protein
MPTVGTVRHSPLNIPVDGKTATSVVPASAAGVLHGVASSDVRAHPLENIRARNVVAKGYSPLGKTHVAVTRPPRAYKG